MKIEPDAWGLEESLTWEESIFEDGFIFSMEDNEIADSLCDNIYKIEEEEIEWERLRKNR